jgi:hypothetical protein
MDAKQLRLALDPALAYINAECLDAATRRDEAAALLLWRLIENVIRPQCSRTDDPPQVQASYRALGSWMRDVANGGRCDANFPDDHRQQLIADRLDELAKILNERLPARRSHHGKPRRLTRTIDRAA